LIKVHKYKRDPITRIEKCSICGSGKLYDWIPGWPGWFVYYDNKGNDINSETECNERDELDGIVVLGEN